MQVVCQGKEQCATPGTASHHSYAETAQHQSGPPPLENAMFRSAGSLAGVVYDVLEYALSAARHQSRASSDR
jgi:hypothetical protein